MRGYYKARSYTKSLVFLALVTGITTGCVLFPKLSSDKKKDTPVRSSLEYSPNKNLSQFGVDSGKLAGKYSGIYFCGSLATQFVLNIKLASAGNISGTIQRINLSFNNRGSRLKSMTTESALTGRYDETSSSVSFRITTPDRRNIHRHKQQAAFLQGILMPDAGAFVAFDKLPLGRQCSPWIAQRGNSFPDNWEYLEKEAEPNSKVGFFDRFSITREQKKDRSKNSCDPKLLGWLMQSQGFSRPNYNIKNHFVRAMYSDKYFVPHFGKPFHKLDGSDRHIYAIRLAGSCSRDPQVNQDRRAITMQVAQSFQVRSQITDVDKSISALGFNLLHDWLQLNKQHFKYMADNQGEPDDVKRILASNKSVLELLFPEEKDDFVNFANVQYNKMIIPKLKHQLEGELTNKTVTMATLNALAGFESRSKQKYPTVNNSELSSLVAQVKQRVNAGVLPAAKQFAPELSGMPGISSLDGWRQQFTHLVPLLSTSNAEQVQVMFNQRRVEIADEILIKEKQAFQRSVVSHGATPAALIAGVEYENNFNTRYNVVLNSPGYAEFSKARMSARNSALAGAVAAMANLINKQKHERIVREVEKNYLLTTDRDSVAGKKIYAALDKKLAAVAPFSGDNFSTYLNAIYSYDYELLRMMDKTSTAPIANSMKSIMPAMKGMGTLLEAISGGAIPGRKMMEAQEKKLAEASLIYPIMAYYVLNYEKYNSACLEKNALDRKVEYRWTEYETQNGFRHEVDSGGTDTYYKVNRRFVHIFDVIYESDGDDVMAKFADRFFKGTGKIYRNELIDGTYKLMSRSCKGKVIKNMEPQMIRYFNDVKKRMDAITREMLRR